jgi:hypothetical protein
VDDGIEIYEFIRATVEDRWKDKGVIGVYDTGVIKIVLHPGRSSLR